MSATHKARVWLEAVAAGPLTLSGERAHYVHHVLRLSPGEALTLLGGDGQVAKATVVAVGPGRVELAVDPPRAQGVPSVALTVALATAKGDRSDWAIEKLTELGVMKVVIMTCEHSVVMPREKGSRIERWQRVAHAAARQAVRATPPEITGPLSFDDCLQLGASARLIADASGLPLVHLLARLAQSEQTGEGSTAAPVSVVILIGPEGGFSAAELLRAQDAGYSTVSLSPYTLRVETAAVACAAVLLSAAELILA